ncbi:MAG: sugar ABC transporter permease, partial [Chloroflexi bacterium]|nr:sugar ABC transporter permease [Chloroflexota bacterium]
MANYDRDVHIDPDELYGRHAGSARRVSDREAVNWLNIRRSWQAYLLLLPVFALLLLFNYYPPVLGLVRAFYDWAPLKKPVFVGLQNFADYLFYYPESAREFTNIAKFLVYSMFAHVGMPFVMAELIYSVRKPAIKEFYRFLVVLPMLVPQLVALLLWRHMYDPAFGPINALLEVVGMGTLTRNWLGDPKTALYAVMMVNFPWVATVGTLICLGGLSQISDSIVDACLLDGCTGLG